MTKANHSGLTENKNEANIILLLRPYWRIIIILIVFTLAGNGINLIIPKIISHGIDSFNKGQYILISTVTWFLGASVAIFIFTYLQYIVQTYSSERVARDLRFRLSEKISKQSYSFILKAIPSKLLTNLTSDIDSVKMFVSQAVATIVSSAFIIIATSIILLTINQRLALPVILMIPLIGITFFFIFKKVKVLFTRGREVIDWLNKVINESILGAAIIRVINSQQHEYRKFMEASLEAKDIGISILTLFATLIPVITFVANLATLTILALGGHYVINGSLSLGDFAAFNSYVTILIFPIIIIGFMSNVIAQASASYQRIDQVLRAPVTKETGTSDKKLTGNIVLENITHMYGVKPVLKNVSRDRLTKRKLTYVSVKKDSKL